MKIAKHVSKLVLAGALVSAILPATASAKELSKKNLDYVALGDSLAVGITPYGEDNLGYPDYLAQRFEQSQYHVHLDNLGVPGFTSAQLANAILTDPTTQQKIKESDLITLDIGANDLLGVLQVLQDDPASAGTAIANVKVYLDVSLKAIKELNPKTKVYVMGYYNPFPNLPADQQAQLLPLLDLLNGVIQAEAAKYGYTYVETDKVIAKHAKEYLPNPLSVHPDLEGYQVIAKQFWKAIDKD